MAEDNTQQIIVLTAAVGELTGEMKALVSCVNRFTTETRKINSDQWEKMTLIDKEGSEGIAKVTRDCSEHRLSSSMKTAGISGGTSGSLLLAWEVIKHYFKGGG